MSRKSSDQTRQRAKQLLEKAAELRLAGHLLQAERAVARASALLRDSVEARGSARGQSEQPSDDVALVKIWHATLAADRGRHAVARSAYADVLRELGRVRRSEDESRALLRLYALQGRARSCRELGELTDSSRCSARALRLARARLGKGHLLTALSLIDIGVLRKAQGRYDEALAAYREALPIVLREQGPRGFEAASLYHNLGGIEHSRNNLARAETWARKAVEVRRALMGESDVTVAADEAALAAILEARDKFAEAFDLYRHARAVFQRKQGKASHEVAYNLANTAALLQRWGRPQDAEREYRKALPLLRKTLGRQHAQVAMTLSNYGVLLSELGRTRPAVRHLEAACAIAAATLPAHHPQRKLYAYNLKHLKRHP